MSMERLVKREYNNVFINKDTVERSDCPGEFGFQFCKNATKCPQIHNRKCPVLRCMDKLAAYEDTGLSPEEIKVFVDWISVEERLPEIKNHYCSDEVMVFTADGIMGIDHLEQTAMGGYVFSVERPDPYGTNGVEVTHWMPLPEPPKEVSE